MYDLGDILFFIKSVKTPNNSFDIINYVSFVRGATRSSDTKLVHRTTDNCITCNSYFYRIPRLWNALPEIDLTLSINTMKTKLNTFYGTTSCTILILITTACYIFFVLVVTVPVTPLHLISYLCNLLFIVLHLLYKSSLSVDI